MVIMYTSTKYHRNRKAHKNLDEQATVRYSKFNGKPVTTRVTVPSTSLGKDTIVPVRVSVGPAQ